jgi:alkylation response protein AidB-like acyl-CoA dehydrogenase
VDFQLTEEQVSMRDGMHKLCLGLMPIATIRTLEGVGYSEAMWSSLADVFTLRLSADEGGSGLGVLEACLVFEELGRGLVPGPLVWTHLSAGLVPGPVVGGVPRSSAPVLVEHLDSLTDLVVTDSEGVWLVDPASVRGTSVEALDPLTPVTLVSALPMGTQIGSLGDLARWSLVGGVLVAAQMAGMALALVDLTVAYTSSRLQFGRPVGSFQALKHTMADMVTRAELARVQVYAAARHIDESLPGASRAMSAAKVLASRAALQNGADSIQCHGGMGYTWEVDSHLYLKRAWVLDPMFGSGDDHALAMADHISEGDTWE